MIQSKSAFQPRYLFPVRAVKLFKILSLERKEFVLSKQVLRAWDGYWWVLKRG
jgi:hypothetical protein